MSCGIRLHLQCVPLPNKDHLQLDTVLGHAGPNLLRPFVSTNYVVLRPVKRPASRAYRLVALRGLGSYETCFPKLLGGWSAQPVE